MSDIVRNVAAGILVFLISKAIEIIYVKFKHRKRKSKAEKASQSPYELPRLIQMLCQLTSYLGLMGMMLTDGKVALVCGLIVIVPSVVGGSIAEQFYSELTDFYYKNRYSSSKH